MIQDIFFLMVNTGKLDFPSARQRAILISLSSEYSGLISFRMDWLDLLEVQGTLKSLLQYHSSKASILQCSAFFTVQLSHPYMTTGKTIALTKWTFVRAYKFSNLKTLYLYQSLLHNCGD